MLVASLFLGWFARKMSQAKFEAELVEKLSELEETHHCDFWQKYDYQLDNSRKFKARLAEPAGPKWVRSIFGQYIFSRIASLYLRGEREGGRGFSGSNEQSFSETIRGLDLNKLEGLRELNFSSFADVNELTMFEDLTNLERVFVDRCKNLRSLGGIEKLSKLKQLNVSEYESVLCDVEALRELKGLETIQLDVGDGFANPVNWDSLSNKPALVELNLKRRTGRRRLRRQGESIFKYEFLKDLKANGQFSPSPNLEFLTFDEIDPGLKDLSCCQKMPRLRSLRIIGSRSLTSLAGIEHCKNLTHLIIDDCRNLQNVEGVENLQRLMVLSINFSHKSLTIPKLDCPELTVLSLREIQGLQDLKFLENAKRLEILDVSRSSLPTLEGLEHIESLEELNTSGCDLERVGCGKVTAPLTRLDFSFCKELSDLKGLENFSGVKILKLNGCAQVDSLQFPGKMPALEYLDISGCTLIEDLNELNQIPQLNIVIANGCNRLADVDGLLKLEKLLVFEWKDCPMLETRNVARLTDKFPGLDEWPDVNDTTMKSKSEY